MSESWHEELGFESNPYNLQEPWVTPLEKLIWNRDDLDKVKLRSDDFIEEINGGYNSSIFIWGPWRSGKSWLGRLIEKQVKKEGVFFITINIQEGNPSQEAFYEQFIKKLIDSDWISLISSKISDPESLEAWQRYFENEDLGRILYNIYENKDKFTLSREWLSGEKLTTTNLNSIDVKINLNSLYEKMETLKILINKSQESFNSFILCVDQLEGARGRPARLLSDLLREINDSFYDKFGMILIMTMESEADWYTYGFTDPLRQRVKYTVEMELLQRDYIPIFLQKHHEVYRVSDWNKSHLLPFQKTSIIYLADLMEVDTKYPRFLLSNCARLGKELVKKGRKTVTTTFIDKNIRHLRWILEKKSTQSRLEDNIS